jgi:U3 small nucleolar RNA-associated protein 12
MKDTLGFNLAAMGHIQHLLTKRSDAASKAVGMKLLDIRAKIAKKREENKPKPRKRQKKLELSRSV